MLPTAIFRPYRPFYFLATCDAVLGVVLAAPFAAAVGSVHQSLLLFGTLPAILAGFLLTALPRWTGCKPVSRPTVYGLVMVWLVMRITFFAAGANAANAISSLFILSLACLVGLRVIAVRNRRNYSVAALLLIYGTAPLVSLRSMPLAEQLAVAVIVCLMIIIAGRVIPALSAAGLGEETSQTGIWIERVAGMATAAALSIWILLPDSMFTAYICLTAALVHLVRLAAWRGWRTVSVPSALFLHMAYLWIPAGFGLLFWHILSPEAIGASAAIHAWFAGAFGSLAIAIMGSMMRRHARRPFDVPIIEYCAYALVTLAAVTRLMVELTGIDGTLFMNEAAIAWTAAFCAFLYANRRSLMPFGKA